MALIGSVEGGGTKFVCAVAREPGKLLAEEKFPTTSPEETLQRVAAFFQQQQDVLGEPLHALGIGMFGPVEVGKESPDFGRVLKTPKDGWSGADILGPLRQALPGTRFDFDTDVNAAAIGEGAHGAAAGLDTFIYITVGTGIGGGVIVNGRPRHGYPHPEIGHIKVPRDRRDSFGGVCRFHGDCLEGLACGPAVERRWGKKGQDLGNDHEAWDLEAHYLAHACHNLIFTLCPQRIVLGGGVLAVPGLFDKVKVRAKQLAGGYFDALDIDDVIVRPGLGDLAGIVGGLEMARRLLA